LNASDNQMTVTLPSQYAALIRGFAQAQKCTYRSAVCACIQAMLSHGGPFVLEPFGEKKEGARNEPAPDSQPATRH